jgi:RHS repeat-associated protein
LNNDPSTPLKTIGFEFDQAGRLASTADWNASMQAISGYEYEYDVRNQLRFETATIAGLTPQVKLERTYDEVGNRKMLRAELVNGSTITKDFQNDYTFDSLFRLTQIKQTSQGTGSGYHLVQDKRIDLTYNKLGQFTSINRLESLTTSDDNLETVYSYDSSNRLSMLSHQRDGGNHVLSQYEYSYDAMNRITSIDHTAGTGGYADGLSQFTYDKASQLTGADHAPPRPDEAYQFDANGNRTGGAYQNEANNQTKYDGTYTYYYDKEGNRIRRFHGSPTSEEDLPFDEYVYDHRNRLVQVKQFQSEADRYYDFVNYTYDSFNRMLKRQSGTFDTRNNVNTQTRDQYFTGYDGINPTLEFETSGTTSAPAATESNLKHRYLWGPVVDQLLADEQYTGTNSPATTEGNTLWALADHLGTIRDIADFDTSFDPAKFTIVNHRVFDSFGRLTSETNSSIKLSFAYTGKFLDEATNLSHHWNRWYDPQLGKWISEDPIGFAGGDTNLSRYVKNVATTFLDSTGLRQDGILDSIKYHWNGYWHFWVENMSSAGGTIHQTGHDLGDFVGSHGQSFLIDPIEEIKVIGGMMQDGKENLVVVLDSIVFHPVVTAETVYDHSIETLDKITSNPEEGGKFLGNYATGLALTGLGGATTQKILGRMGPSTRHAGNQGNGTNGSSKFSSKSDDFSGLEFLDDTRKWSKPDSFGPNHVFWDDPHGPGYRPPKPRPGTTRTDPGVNPNSKTTETLNPRPEIAPDSISPSHIFWGEEGWPGSTSTINGSGG